MSYQPDHPPRPGLTPEEERAVADQQDDADDAADAADRDDDED